MKDIISNLSLGIVAVLFVLYIWINHKSVDIKRETNRKFNALNDASDFFLEVCYLNKNGRIYNYVKEKYQVFHRVNRIAEIAMVLFAVTLILQLIL